MSRYFGLEADGHRKGQVLELRAALKARGYGVYIMLLQELTERSGEGFVLPLNYKALGLLLGESPKIIKQVIEDFGLFDIDLGRGVFTSPALLGYMRAVGLYHQRAAAETSEDAAAEEQAPNVDTNSKRAEERKADISSKRAEAGRKGGKVYRPSQAKLEAEEAKSKQTSKQTEAKSKQTEAKLEAEEAKSKQTSKQTEAKSKQNGSKSADFGGIIGGKEKEKEENKDPKRSSSPQCASVSEGVGVGAGVVPRVGRADAREAEPQAMQPSDAATAEEQGYIGQEWVDVENFKPSGHALVCRLKETYDTMRAANPSWKPCKAITAEMLADAAESLAHYGTPEAIEELMQRATDLPFLQGKANLQRLAWLLKLKTLSAIDEEAYSVGREQPRPIVYTPKPRTVGVPYESSGEERASLAKRWAQATLKHKNQQENDGRTTT